MKLPRRRFLYLAAGAAALPAASRFAWAQAYPSRPVRVIVPFAPAGTTDIAARLMGQWLSERLGQQFVIDNRPGASTTIGTEVVVRAPADGYTLLLAATASAINTTLFKGKLNYNFLRDIVPIAGIFRVPNVMVVNPSVPAKTVPEFIAYAKANPGKINVESPGAGTSSHLAGELFKLMTGVDMVHIQHRGNARANRSSRRTGAGRFRHHACLDRVHQGGQAARAWGVHGDALARAAGPSDRQRIRAGL
jgi:tripartite-type tricarboxylate transporter receptor subunit TctC